MYWGSFSTSQMWLLSRCAFFSFLAQFVSCQNIVDPDDRISGQIYLNYEVVSTEFWDAAGADFDSSGKRFFLTDNVYDLPGPYIRMYQYPDPELQDMSDATLVQGTGWGTDEIQIVTLSSRRNLLYVVSQKKNGVMMFDVGTYEESLEVEEFPTFLYTDPEDLEDDDCKVENVQDAKLFSTLIGEVMYIVTIPEKKVCVLQTVKNENEPTGYSIERSPESGNNDLTDECVGAKKFMQTVKHVSGKNYLLVWCQKVGLAVMEITSMLTGHLERVFFKPDTDFPRNFNCDITGFVTSPDQTDPTTKMHLYARDNRANYWHLIMEADGDVHSWESESFDFGEDIYDISVVRDATGAVNFYFLGDGGIAIMKLLDDNTLEESHYFEINKQVFQIWSPMGMNHTDDIVVFMKSKGYQSYQREPFTFAPTLQPTTVPTYGPTYLPTRPPTTGWPSVHPTTAAPTKPSNTFWSTPPGITLICVGTFALLFLIFWAITADGLFWSTNTSPPPDNPEHGEGETLKTATAAGVAGN